MKHSCKLIRLFPATTPGLALTGFSGLMSMQREPQPGVDSAVYDPPRARHSREAGTLIRS